MTVQCSVETAWLLLILRREQKCTAAPHSFLILQPFSPIWHFEHFFDSQPHAKSQPLTMLHACSFSFTQLDSSVQNLDMQEFEYNPSKKDLTDAKIHHMLSEELCKPRRVSADFLLKLWSNYRKTSIAEISLWIWSSGCKKSIFLNNWFRCKFGFDRFALIFSTGGWATAGTLSTTEIWQLKRLTTKCTWTWGTSSVEISITTKDQRKWTRYVAPHRFLCTFACWHADFNANADDALFLHNELLLALYLQEGKQHVSFPGITQNGSVKQFTHGTCLLISSLLCNAKINCFGRLH